MRREIAKLAACVALFLASLAWSVACAPPWQDGEILGADVEWPDDGPRPVREVARAVCAAAEASPDARLISGATVVVLASAVEVESACMRPAAGCWHPDYDDTDGAGTIYLGPPGDGAQFSDGTLRHELGHLARWRWLHDADTEHADLEWWARFDSGAP